MTTAECAECGKTIAVGACDCSGEVVERKTSKRVDQLRRDFVTWIDEQIAQFDIEWKKAMDESEWLRAMGYAIRIHQMSETRTQFLAQSR